MPSLVQYHTFHLPSSSQALCHFSSAEELVLHWNQTPNGYILGGGSNTLFLEDYQGTVFVNNMRGVIHNESELYHHIRVAGGENWHEFVSHCLQNSWHGLENLALIPGSVGASPIQNIGAYGVEVERYIESVEFVTLNDGNHHTYNAEQCKFGYRDSIFKHELAGQVLITYVTFRLPKHAEMELSYGELALLRNPTPQKIYDKVIEVRRAKLPDPDILGNAGSFFKNPVISAEHFSTLKAENPSIPGFPVDGKMKVPAAWLIDQSGFKGQSSGGVRCHPTQPLVLTNTGDAKGSDVVQMATNIMQTINNKFGVQLEPEVRLMGNRELVQL